jgi:hypothetical protein
MSKSPPIKTNCHTSDYNGIVCVRISPDDHCRMTISARKLVRSDDRAAGLRGLKDLETGERFFINEEDLFRPTVTRARQGPEYGYTFSPRA